MLVKITICDDVTEEIGGLTKVLLAYNPLFEIISFSSGKTLMDELKDDNLTLDIYMPGLNGIQTAQQIRSIHKDLKFTLRNLGVF